MNLVAVMIQSVHSARLKLKHSTRIYIARPSLVIMPLSISPTLLESQQLRVFLCPAAMVDPKNQPAVEEDPKRGRTH